ncbi:ATP-binding protein [Oscillatoriales cyanobacterium LEGE 11467]|uniref:ATP-binding protein n=1 Tax=Zarconia navalis LEGE 11467 TaxID=1828826 RepID=A0A928VXS7_9CYAN|nr:ATP-binding protein [Zarconia navalis]MBE9042081.1 ATP-binding protein [Zarconia navalis LEGE 11467]
MALNLPKFYRNCNPSKTLNSASHEAQQYYIDFSDVRGSNIVEELLANITLFSPEEPTCQLFTGHIGCGKSTELLRLKFMLEREGFHVVYFESSQDLDMGDVDIGDILLAIAHQIACSIEFLSLKTPTRKLQNLLRGAWKALKNEFEIRGSARSTFHETALEKEGHFSLSWGLRQLTTHSKNSPEVRSKLRQYLEPRVGFLLEAIEEELIDPAIVTLKEQGGAGLVTIVDNLDRVENRRKPWGRSQPEYLFVDRGEQLRKLQCHIVYTIPISLMFSSDLGRLTLRFGVDPKVLPMIPVKDRREQMFEEGMVQMRQMVLARAFPELTAPERLKRLGEVFDTASTLDRLCYISGGHARNLLRLLHRCIEKERHLPLSRDILEATIRERCAQLALSLDDSEWELLRQVAQLKRVRQVRSLPSLIRSMFVFEYRDENGSWFDINPILAEAQGFKS